MEIVADILYNLLFGCCCEARYRYTRVFSLAYLVSLYKLTNVEIVDTEVLALGRETVCFVYNKSHHMAGNKYAFYGV